MKPLSLICLCLACAVSNAQQVSLNEALRRAAETRPLVKSAKLSVEQARLAAKALGAYAPTVLGVGASSRNEVGATDGDLYLSQPIDVFGRTAANRRAGNAAVRSAEASFRGVLLALQADVATSYFDALSAAQLSSTADELVVIAEGIQTATRRRFEEGKVAEVQVSRASIELNRTRQSARARKSQYEAALKRLSALVGMTVTELDMTAGVPIPNTSVMTSRPDLQLLAADIEGAEAEAGIARKTGLPELEIQARRSPWKDQEVFYGGRLQLTWSILDHGRSKYEAQSALKKADAARNQYRDAQVQAQAEVDANKIELDAAEAQVKSLTELLASAKSLVEKSQKGFSEGVSTLVDILEATRALREIEQELAEARHTYNLAGVSRLRISGTLLEVSK